jgi:hypothetical protein
MLTVLYANGEGVQRDLSLALRFACEAEGAPAEIIGRIESLKSLEQSGGISGPKFDFCDDITSGFMEGFCAARGAEIEDQERNQQLLKALSELARTRQICLQGTCESAASIFRSPRQR